MKRKAIELKVAVIDEEFDNLGVTNNNEVWVDETVYIDSIEAYRESTDEVLRSGLTCLYMKSGDDFITNIKYVDFKSMMKEYEEVLSDGSCKLDTSDLDEEFDKLDNITGAINKLLEAEDKFVYKPQTGMSEKTYRYLLLAVWSLMAVGIIAHLIIE